MYNMKAIVCALLISMMLIVNCTAMPANDNQEAFDQEESLDQFRAKRDNSYYSNQITLIRKGLIIDILLINISE